jgi:hypothetical protein
MALSSNLEEQATPKSDEIASPFAGFPVVVDTLVCQFAKIKTGTIGEVIASERLRVAQNIGEVIPLAVRSNPGI